MFPVLLAIGPFELRTLSIFSLLAFFVSAFVFWRKGREEHYDLSEYFDGFILATLIGFLCGRIGFIILNWGQFGWQVLKYFDVISYPGVNGVVALVAAAMYLYTFAHKRKWDEFEVLDFWVLAAANGSIWQHIGTFFDGTHFGTLTELPLGMVFPGTQEPRHPSQLYSALFFMLLAWYLSRVEYRYRTFEWYRGGKKNAKSGFLFTVFLLTVSLWYFATSWVREPVAVAAGINIDRILAAVSFGAGLLFLLSRAGILGAKKRQQVSKEADETLES